MSTTKAIPVVAAKVAATLADFPVYLKPSAMTGWGALTAAEAASLRFYSDEAKTTELAREIVGSGDEIHVKVPSLTTTTIIYADYDGIRADYAVTDTYGRNAVWGGVGYSGVWHLDSTSDSTANGNNLTNNGSTPFSAGKIGNSAAYGSSNTTRWLNTANSMGLNTQNAGVMTISGWLNLGTLPTGGVSVGIYGMVDIGNPQLEWVLTSAGTLGLVRWNGSSAQVLLESYSFSINTWYKVDFIKNGTAVNILVNGVSIGTRTITFANGNGSAGQDRFAFGRHPNANANYVKGSQDEVKIIGSALSTDWLTTEYNNQSDVATFWGTVTDVGGATANNSARRMLLMGM